MTSYPQKIDVKSCGIVEPPHPCDPPVPCDPHSEPEGDCFPPFLCKERIKNPESPDHLSKRIFDGPTLICCELEFIQFLVQFNSEMELLLNQLDYGYHYPGCHSFYIRRY